MPVRFVRLAACALVLACAQAPAGSPTPAGAPGPRRAASEEPAATAEPREQAADQQVIHALNRLTFGARPGDVQHVRALGVDRWIADQLQPERIADREAERTLQRFPLIQRRAADLMREFPPPGALLAQQRREMQGGSDRPPSASDTAEYRKAAREAGRAARQIPAELGAARVARAVVSARQLQEVMVDFWHNHFSVFAGKGPAMRYYLVDYDRDVIRPNALGSFRDLLGAVAASPAMLTYLDNAASVADSGQPTRAQANRPPQQQGAGRRRGLNENYARELLELHTLGVDGGYTQNDVIAVARAFTGWTVLPPRATDRMTPALRRRLAGSDPERGFLFRPDVHDAGAKTVLGVQLRAGRGIEDGQQVLDIVAQHPATARFIAMKLARRFVSDTPPGALVDRAAATFTRTDGDICETLRTIVTSPEFFSRAAYRAKVKSPFEVVTSALRALGATADTSVRTLQLIAYLGQPLFGHQAPNGYLETGKAWINAGAILNRINFGLAVAAGRVPGVTLTGWAPGVALRGAGRAAQVDGVVAAVLNGDVSADTRAVLLSGEHPLLASPRFASAADSALARQMADSADDGMGHNRAFGTLPPLDGLAQVLGLALGSPEFQRR